jgi:phenylpropionate dioxygenase-like ring-hydroxylating dioxygenase large terminal subunit
MSSADSFENIDTSRVPFRIQNECSVDVERYCDQTFFDLECEHMWPRVWQVACRIEEVPEVGDFTEYEIVDQSILIVRAAPDRIKAYFNTCRHRGAQLEKDCGRFENGQIVCPYHGWQWNLEGSNTFVYGERDFGRPINREKVRLQECKVETRWGLVFINMDPDAPPLEQSLAGIAGALDPVHLELMRVDWWQYTELDANWKVAQEAFLEAYHIMQSHPEIAVGRRGDDFDMASFRDFGLSPLGHGWAQPQGLSAPARGLSAAEWVVANDRALFEGARTWMTEGQLEIEQELLAKGLSDEEFITEWVAALQVEAAERGVPLPLPTPEATGWCHVFPNTTLICAYGHALIYKFRPNGRDPERAIFDVCAVSLRSASAADPSRPDRVGPVPQADWPFVLGQDIGNIERQQAGMRNRGFERCHLSPSYEPMILNMHRALDRYLAQQG